MLIGLSGLRHQILTLIRRRQLFLFLVRIVPLVLKPGDGLLYKGCERPHWRDPMPGVRKEEDKIPVPGKEDKSLTYYHQIFFHYVLQDGHRAHCAWDRSR